MSNIITNRERDIIIEQQDFLIYYMTRLVVETDLTECPENLSFAYSKVKDFFIENQDYFEKLSTNNLVLLISSFFAENEKEKNAIEKIQKMLMDRLENGERILAGSTIEFDFLGATSRLLIGMRKLSKENYNVIKSKILKDYEEQKENSEFADIFDLFTSIVSVDNFMECLNNGIFNTPEKIEALRRLAQKNPNLIANIDFNLFRDDIFQLGLPFIEHVGSYPNISFKVVKLSENNPQLIQALGTILDIKNGELPIQKYEDIEMLVSYFAKRCFSLKDVHLNLEELESCAVRHWSFLTTSNSKEKIDCDYDVNYEEKYIATCDTKFSEVETLEEKKNILLNKYFSITLSEAKKLVEIYATNIEAVRKLAKNMTCLAFLDAITNILEITDISEIEELYKNPTYSIKPNMLLRLRDELRNLYAISYTNNLFDTYARVDFIRKTEAQHITFNGQNIEIIPLTGRFDFLVHSSDTGFKGEKKLVDDSFKKTWEDIKDSSTHLLATSYINNDNLGVAPVNGNGVLYAFTNVPTERIQLVGNTDINSHVRTSYYSAVNARYVAASDVSYQTRRVYNEIAIERNGLIPNYIILFDDMNEQVRQNSYRAAVEWGIPIIYIDKEKILEQQIEGIDTLIELYDDTKSPEILQEIFNTYETNISGWLLNRNSEETKETFTDQIDNSRFGDKLSQVRDRVMDTASRALDNPQSKDFSIYMIRALMYEKELYDRANVQSTPISKTEMGIDAELLLTKAIIGQSELLDSIQAMGFVHSAEEIREAARLDAEYRITNVFEIAKAIIEAEKDRFEQER